MVKTNLSRQSIVFNPSGKLFIALDPNDLSERKKFRSKISDPIPGERISYIIKPKEYSLDLNIYARFAQRRQMGFFPFNAVQLKPR
jgi:hypothetical protein